MASKKQIYKPGTLEKIASGENSCVSLVQSERKLALLPIYQNDIKSGVSDLLYKSLKKFDRNLNGILMGYKNVKILLDDRNTGRIKGRCGEFEVNVKLEFYIFQPKIGSYLEGVVNKKGNTHIGCLVHLYFNATILKPDHIEYEDWCCKDINVGDKIIFKVVDLDFSDVLPRIEGFIEGDFGVIKRDNDEGGKSLNVNSEESVNESNNVDLKHTEEKSENNNLKSPVKRKNLICNSTQRLSLIENDLRDEDFNFLSPVVPSPLDKKKKEENDEMDVDEDLVVTSTQVPLKEESSIADFSSLSPIEAVDGLLKHKKKKKKKDKKGEKDEESVIKALEFSSLAVDEKQSSKDGKLKGKQDRTIEEKLSCDDMKEKKEEDKEEELNAKKGNNDKKEEKLELLMKVKERAEDGKPRKDVNDKRKKEEKNEFRDQEKKKEDLQLRKEIEDQEEKKKNEIKDSKKKKKDKKSKKEAEDQEKKKEDQEKKSRLEIKVQEEKKEKEKSEKEIEDKEEKKKDKKSKKENEEREKLEKEIRAKEEEKSSEKSKEERKKRRKEEKRLKKEMREKEKKEQREKEEKKREKEFEELRLRLEKEIEERKRLEEELRLRLEKEIEESRRQRLELEKEIREKESKKKKKKKPEKESIDKKIQKERLLGVEKEINDKDKKLKEDIKDTKKKKEKKLKNESEVKDKVKKEINSISSKGEEKEDKLEKEIKNKRKRKPEPDEKSISSPPKKMKVGEVDPLDKLLEEEMKKYKRKVPSSEDSDDDDDVIPPTQLPLSDKSLSFTGTYSNKIKPEQILPVKKEKSPEVTTKPDTFRNKLNLVNNGGSPLKRRTSISGSETSSSIKKCETDPVNSFQHKLELCNRKKLKKNPGSVSDIFSDSDSSLNLSPVKKVTGTLRPLDILMKESKSPKKKERKSESGKVDSKSSNKSSGNLNDVLGKILEDTKSSILLEESPSKKKKKAEKTKNKQKSDKPSLAEANSKKEQSVEKIVNGKIDERLTDFKSDSTELETPSQKKKAKKKSKELDKSVRMGSADSGINSVASKSTENDESLSVEQLLLLAQSQVGLYSSKSKKKKNTSK